MNERLEKVKTHIKGNRKVYIGVGVGIVVGAVGAMALSRNTRVINVVDAFNLKYKSPTSTTIVTTVNLPARGHRGYAIVNEDTRDIYGSINQAAKELAVSRASIVDHLNGLRPDVNGNHLVNLGENLTEEIKVSR